jgi:hypothetical protein
MEENVKKELDTIKEMVLRWKESYLGWATSDGGNDYLIEEFSEEISIRLPFGPEVARNQPPEPV